MEKIPEEALELAKARGEQLQYGNVRIEVLEGKPYVDVIIEERIRVMKPIPGNLASPTIHHG